MKRVVMMTIKPFALLLVISTLLSAYGGDDGNSGIDLEDLGAKLASATNSFNNNPFDFADDEMGDFSSPQGFDYGDDVFFDGYSAYFESSDTELLLPAQNHGQPIAVKSLVHLNESLQLTAPVHLQILVNSDDNNDGTECDVRGRITTEWHDYDVDVNDTELVQSYTYDAEGNVRGL